MNTEFQEIEKELLENIENELNVRATLDTILSCYGYNSRFIIGCAQIAERNEKVFEEHDGTKFNEDKKHWTQDYFSEIQSELLSNFSKERYKHLIDIAAYLSEGDSKNLNKVDSVNNRVNNNDKVVVKMSSKKQNKSEKKADGKNINFLIAAAGVAVAGGALALWFLLRKN